MKIGSAIKEMRTRKGLTQQALADQAGITRAYLSQIEGNHKKPTLETVEKLSEAMEVPPQVLLFLSLTEEDIPEDRRESYGQMYDIVKDMLERTVHDNA